MTTYEKFSLAKDVLLGALLAVGLFVLWLTRLIARMSPERKAGVINWLSPRPRAARVFAYLVKLGPNAPELERVLQTAAEYGQAGWAIALLKLIDPGRDVTLLPPPPALAGQRPSQRPIAVPRERVEGRYSYTGRDEIPRE